MGEGCLGGTPRNPEEPEELVPLGRRLLQACLLVRDEAEDVDLAGLVEVLGDLEELDRQQRVQALVEDRLALSVRCGERILRR